MGVLKEFKDFAVKGSGIDMAVGIIIGAASTALVNSVVKDVITPPLGLITTRLQFEHLFILLRPGASGGPYATPALAHADGAVTLNIGLFLNSLVSFLIVAVVLFFVVRTSNRLRHGQGSDVTGEKRKCPRCDSEISQKASRCPHCTSDIADTMPEKA